MLRIYRKLLILTARRRKVPGKLDDRFDKLRRDARRKTKRRPFTA